VRTPLVSVVVTCFNQAPWVEECLDSVVAQDHPNVELIIVDGCSIDDSVVRIRSWIERTGTRATLIRHETNRGICASRNDALSAATGEYVDFVAADDLIEPTKLSSHVALLESLPADVAAVYGDAHQITTDGGAHSDATLLAQSLQQLGMAHPPTGDVFDALLIGCFVCQVTTLIRRRCLDEIGPFDEGLAYEDWDMWLRLARRFQLVFSPGTWGSYRHVPASLSLRLGDDFAKSTSTIFEKQLGSNERHDAVIRRKLRSIAVDSYTSESTAAPSLLLRATKTAPTIAVRILAGSARIGVPGRVWRPIVRLNIALRTRA
jgi:glycosyltransferase involved in cell wall biosynthesis